MTLATVGLWILIIFILGFVLDFFLKQVFVSGGYRLFVAPGIILHELSHAFACLLMRAKVREINFFDRKGGYVKHEKSKIPVIGPVIISLAPLLVGIVLIYFLSKILLGNHGQVLELSFSQSNFQRILNTISSINLLNIKNLLLFYLITSVSITMAPSWRDFANAFFGLIILVVAILLVNYFFVIRLPESLLVFTFSLVTLVLIISLFFSIILAVIKTIFIR